MYFINLIGEIKLQYPIKKGALRGLLARPSWLWRLCDLLVPGASEGSRLITPAGCSAGYLRLSCVVVFVVFASRSPCMMMVMCVWAAAEPVSSSVHAPQVAWPLRWPRPPSPSCLVGLGGVGGVVVGVAWITLGSDFSTTSSFSGCTRVYTLRE